MTSSKYLIFAISLVSFVLNPVLVYAQQTSNQAVTSVKEAFPQYNAGVDQSIKDYLCTPSDPADGKDLQRCVDRLVRFVITAGALVLVFFIIVAGYIYITGGESGKGKAKSYIFNSVVGMVILLGSYTLLNFINPSLVTYKIIQPPIFNANNLPGCADLGLGANCIIATSEGITSSGNGSVVSIAMGELGKRGTAQNLLLKTAWANNRGPQIEKYFQPGGTPGQPWCAYFATWVYGQAGIKTIGTLPGRGGTLTLNSYFKNNNGKSITEGKLKYISAQEVNSGNVKILPGDLVFYDRGSEGDPNGHTAIALGYDPSTKQMTSIDGNQDQSDEVRKKVRDINKECTGEGTCKLIGIGRVEK